MACGCEKKIVARDSYVYIAPDGTKTVYSSELEARAKAARLGGSWVKK